MVSIIVPTFNLELYIGNCLSSLINQTYTDLEIIVVDDGSKDRTTEIVKEFQAQDSRIHLFIQENGGAAKARNKGLDNSNGEYIVFVDGDDMLELNTVQNNLSILEKDLSIDWVAFSIIRTDSNGNPVNLPDIYNNIIFTNSRVINKDEFIPAFKNNILSGVCCGAIYRKSSITSIRFPEGEFYEDGFFFTDLLSFTSKGYLSENGRYLYVHRPGSSQLMKLDKAHLISDVKCSIKRLKQYRVRFPQYEEIYKEWENSLYYYYKNEVAKHTEGAEEVFKTFKAHMIHRRDIKYSKEFKFIIYRILGYKNLRQLYKRFIRN